MGTLLMEPGHRLPSQLPVLLRTGSRGAVLPAEIRAIDRSRSVERAAEYRATEGSRHRCRLEEHLHLLDGRPVRELGAGRVDRGSAHGSAPGQTVELPDAYQVPA